MVRDPAIVGVGESLNGLKTGSGLDVELASTVK
jgi:hypothetical protein